MVFEQALYCKDFQIIEYWFGVLFLIKFLPKLLGNMNSPGNCFLAEYQLLFPEEQQY
jgi:hypothetical protein